MRVNIDQFASNQDERFSEVIEHLKNYESTEEIGEFIDVYVGDMQQKMKALHDIKVIMKQCCRQDDEGELVDKGEESETDITLAIVSDSDVSCMECGASLKA